MIAKFLMLVLLFPVLDLSAQPPNLSKYTITQISPLIFSYSNCFLNRFCYKKQAFTKTEIPPLTITDGNTQYDFLVDGRKSVLWSSSIQPDEQGTLNLKKGSKRPFTLTRPYIHEADFNPAKPMLNWKRNYHAIYSGHLLYNAVGEKLFVGFCHGENKNEITSRTCAEASEAQLLQNTIQPNVRIHCPDSATWSGGSPYRDGWDAYNGILSAVWMPVTGLAGDINALSDAAIEIGPIAWPSMAYMTTDSIKTTAGLRHPSSILVGDSLYVFYIESGIYKGLTPIEEGRQGGVKLLRVHVDSALSPHRYQTYYRELKTGAAVWSPSLPARFTKEAMLKYVSIKGSKATDLLGDDNRTSDVVRFSVAKIRGKPYFMGVEEYRIWNDPAYHLALRFSTDLLHWSGRQIIYSAPSWEASLYHYPIFLDKEGTGNTEIDEEDFFILGTPAKWNNSVNKLRLRH
jgi:hypothetical protein